MRHARRKSCTVQVTGVSCGSPRTGDVHAMRTDWHVCMNYAEDLHHRKAQVLRPVRVALFHVLATATSSIVLAVPTRRPPPRAHAPSPCTQTAGSSRLACLLRRAYLPERRSKGVGGARVDARLPALRAERQAAAERQSKVCEELGGRSSRCRCSWRGRGHRHGERKRDQRRKRNRANRACHCDRT